QDTTGEGYAQVGPEGGYLGQPRRGYLKEGKGFLQGSGDLRTLPCASYTGMGYGWGGNKPQTVVSLRKVV
ncbi:hypothetical protein CSW17_03880, partial [Thermus scotoductus]